MDHNVKKCGISCRDRIENFVTTGSIAHSSSTLSYIFEAFLNDNFDNESLGFKNFKVYLTNNCPNSCITCAGDGSCISCPSFAKLSGTSCVCKDNFYLVTCPYTRCEKCDISCKTCNDATSSDCTSCYPEFTLENGVCKPPLSSFFSNWNK